MVKGDITMGIKRGNTGRFETEQGIVRRKDIILAIKNHINERGYSPTYREIAESVKLSSTASLHRHMVILLKEGYISMEKRIPRSIRVLKEYD